MSKPKRVILHVGMLKTGTTSLQIFLCDNNEALAAQRITYFIPKHQKYNSFSNAGFLCWSSLYTARGTAPQDLIYEKDEALFSEFAKEYDTLILSEEFISEMGAEVPGYWEVLKSNLLRLLGNDIIVDVVIFLRRQDDWVFSRWKQQVLNSFFHENTVPTSIPDFMEFLTTARAKGLMDYDIALERIAEVFGREHVIICVHDRKDGSSNDVVNAFLNATNISLHNTNYNSLRANPSITMRTTKALLQISQRKRIDVSRRRIYNTAKVFSQLYPDEQNYYPMSRKDRIQLLSEFELSNEKVSNLYNNGEPLFHMEVPDYCEWRDKPDQSVQDASLLLKLATVSSKTSNLLLKEVQQSNKNTSS